MAMISSGIIKSTVEVLDHHLGAFAEGLDSLLSDYHPDSVLITADETYRGSTEIRGFFAAFISGAKPQFWEAFRIERREVVGPIAYITWSARPMVTLATDTLLVEDGKIATQTFAVLG